MYVISTIIVIITVLINLILGVLVYSKSKHQKGALQFILFLFLTTVWITTSHFADLPTTYIIQLLLIKIDFFVAPMAIWSFLYFLYFFTNPNSNIKSSLLYFTGITSLFLSFLSLFTNLVIQDIESTEFGVAYKQGNLDIIYGGILVVIIIFNIYYLFRTKNSVTGLIKQQLSYLSYGALTASFFLIFSNLTLQRILNFQYSPNVFVTQFLPSLGRSSILFISIFSSYAILKHRLFGIRVVIGEILFWILGSLSVFIFFYTTVLVEQKLFVTFTSPTVIALNVLIAFTVFPILRAWNNRIRKIIRQFSINFNFDQDVVLHDYLTETTQAITTSEVTSILFSTLSDCYHTQKMGLLLINKSTGELTSQWQGFTPDEIKSFEDEESITTLLNDGQPKGLDDLDAVLSFSAAHYNGLLLLGPKKVNETYTTEEMQFIRKLLDYTELNFNRTLK